MRPPSILLSLFLLTSIANAANPTSFCKCTCGIESEIIALDPRSTKSRQLFSRNPLSVITSPILRSREAISEEEPVDATAALGAQQEENADGGGGGGKEESGTGGETGGAKHSTMRAKTCNDCNRQLCLSYNLPHCKTVREDEVFTQCFQRDSAKDEAIVFIFIFLTGSLLSLALLRPWIEKWLQYVKSRSAYVPVANEGEG